MQAQTYNRSEIAKTAWNLIKTGFTTSFSIAMKQAWHDAKLVASLSSDDLLIASTLKDIKEQIGVELTPCDYFIGIKTLQGKRYFNAILKERVSESKDYDKLMFYQKKLGLKIENCGLNRISIFLQK